MSNGMFDISTLLEAYTVYVPEIQRDYAQGRDNDNAKSVREKLLKDIYDVLHEKKFQHVLNYIYGVPTDDGKIVLIDGQQRVTTLFLLKWYLAVKSEEEDLRFMSKLCYATRDSSSEFCGFLMKNGKCIKENLAPSDVIKNHIKFKKRWLNDPTIANMLNMLDAIDKQENDDPQKLYKNIDNIKFSFISLNGFKRTDELYAAMNSRGKQLTPFELIKGELLKKDSGLAAVINGEWLPAFWELSKVYARDFPEKFASPEEYASENHDSFLYYYYSFVVQMIWWCKFPDAANIKKGDRLPSIVDMTKEIMNDASNEELLKYAMKLVEEKLCEYDFKNDFERNKDELPIVTDKVVIFDGRPSDSVQFFKLCCVGGKEFTQAGRCYLWAYIRYCYDKEHNTIVENRTLEDYYLLMRSLYMRRASNETPTSIDKLSLNEELTGDVIIPFEKIITKDESYDKLRQYWSQYGAFFSDYKRKFEVLNNPLVRGVTDNIGNLTDDEQTNNLADNLQWLWETDELDCFKTLAACGFSNLKCEMNGYSDRVFLPFTKKMLKSVFSLRGWSRSEDFKNLLKYLRNNRLKDQVDKIDKIYSFCDWEYYYIKYESFRESKYGQFLMPDEKQRMSFDAKLVENERAIKRKIRNPFLYEIYQKMPTGDMCYSDYIEEKGIDFTKNMDGCFQWKYDGEIYTIDDTKDCIEEFIEQIEASHA